VAPFWLETREIPMEAKGNPIKIKICKNTRTTSYKPKNNSTTITINNLKSSKKMNIKIYIIKKTNNKNIHLKDAPT
jgi:hypothetical protein